MKTLFLFISSVIVSVITFSFSNTVCPTPATIHTQANTESKWQRGSIYEISFLDGCPRMKGKEILLSVPLMEAIQTIRLDDNTSYGDFAIGYKYIEDEDLYVANLLDEFKEL